MSAPRFVSGVASGDPTPDSVVLWSRVDPPARVGWALTDTDDSVVASGEADADERGVVRVCADGLRAGTDHLYRFTCGQERSEVGRTRTIARNPSRVRLGVACCARLPSGRFTGYRALADREVDVVVHLGDYIYEDGDGGDRGPHDPPHECTTLDDYDRRYAQYRDDPDLLALHAVAPWVATLDDHEIDDNVARFGPAGGSPHAVDPERRRVGAAAHARWLPQRSHGNGPTPRDRHLALGDLCDLVMVDTRLGGRAHQVGDHDGPTTEPPPPESPQLLSDEQWSWLDDIVAASTAPWILFASQVQVAPLRLGWLPTRPRTGRGPVRFAPVINPDQWDGYPAERRRLIDLLERHGRADDTVMLSGDLHGRFATAIPRPGRRAIPEVTTPSISAPTFGSMLDARLPLPSSWTARWIKAINPHIDHLDLEHHGATLVDVERDAIRFRDAVRPDAWSLTLRH